MAGKGPAPKHPSTRRRKNADVVPLRVITSAAAKQPELPTFQITVDDRLEEFRWPVQTQEWWAAWNASPLSDDFGVTDWQFLLDTALLHAAYWSGDLSRAGELRLRQAKFGATPEDRLRLKISFEMADAAEDSGKRRRAARTTTASEKGEEGPDPRALLG